MSPDVTKCLLKGRTTPVKNHWPKAYDCVKKEWIYDQNKYSDRKEGEGVG